MNVHLIKFLWVVGIFELKYKSVKKLALWSWIILSPLSDLTCFCFRYADRGAAVKKCTDCFRNNKDDIEEITAKYSDIATNFFIESESAEIHYLNEDNSPMVKLYFADEGPHEITVFFPCLNSCKTDLNKKIAGLRDLVMEHSYGDSLTT